MEILAKVIQIAVIALVIYQGLQIDKLSKRVKKLEDKE